MNVHKYLAQVNIGKVIAPMDSPIMSGFADHLDEINKLAEESEGFIWRLKEDNNNATSIHVFDDPFILINMSVWESVDALYKFVYQSAHVEYLKKRKEWFEKLTDMHMALWWIPQNHFPDCNEAIERLTHIKVNGASAFAFSFKTKYMPDGTQIP
jgi:Domain of unknown function (DUF3291)